MNDMITADQTFD